MKFQKDVREDSLVWRLLYIALFPESYKWMPEKQTMGCSSSSYTTPGLSLFINGHLSRVQPHGLSPQILI